MRDGLPGNVILVKPAGRLANQMFQCLIAHVLQRSAPDAVVRGCNLREFGHVDSQPQEEFVGRQEIYFDGHLFPFREAQKQLKSSSSLLVCIRGWGMRMEYLRGHIDLARQLFPIDPTLKTGFDERHLVISVRLGDVLNPVSHKDYPLLPIDWYRHLIETSGLSPVFVGQFGDDAYSRALQARFPGAPFIHSANPLDDFNILRTSRNVVLSVSTFAWFAAWLSTTAKRIILPICGLFDPRQRLDVDLLPTFDQRYQYHALAGGPWQATSERINAVVSAPAQFRIIQSPKLYRLSAVLSAACTGQRPRGLSLLGELCALRAPASLREWSNRPS